MKNYEFANRIYKLRTSQGLSQKELSKVLNISNKAISKWETAEAMPSIDMLEKLSEIFLQLHISEKSGRGIPTIIESYGKEAIEIRENSIVIKIPFNWINVIGNKVGNKVGKKKKTNRDKIIEEIRNNPNVTNKQLSIIIGISETAIENNIRILRENKIIERIGSKKTGFWKIIE